MSKVHGRTNHRRERERQTERQTNRERAREREKGQSEKQLFIASAAALTEGNWEYNDIRGLVDFLL